MCIYGRFGCIFLSQGQSIKGRTGIWTCRSISQQQKGKIAPCLPLYLSPLFPWLKETFKVRTSGKVQQASKTRLEMYSVYPLIPSHRKRAMEFPVTKALETEVQDRRPWIHVTHVKNGRSQTYKYLVSEGQEVIWQWQTKTKA